MTPEENDKVHQALSEARQDSYLYGRYVERTSMLKAVNDLIESGSFTDATIVQSVLVYLKTKIKKDANEQVS
jgi:hypothetical protein